MERVFSVYKPKGMTTMKIISGLIAFLLMALAGCATTTNAYDPVTQDLPIIDEAYPPAIVELNFDSHGGRLNGILYQANGSGPHPTIILLHGYPGNEKNLDLAQVLRRGGFNVLFFHYRGAWGSGGEFSFTHVVEDVASASTMLRARVDEYRVDKERLILIGHSLGGFAALQGAARDENLKCIAAIAPADIGLVGQNPVMAKGLAAGADDLSMLSGWSRQKALADMTENSDAFSLTGLAPKLFGKSILLIFGEDDEVLPPEIFFTPLVAAYAADQDIKLQNELISGDHSFSRTRIALSRLVLNWAQACIEETP
jgi:uncharacterized protein